MPSNTRALFDCAHCGNELNSVYAIYRHDPIRERYIHWCEACERELPATEAILRSRGPQ
ncbi:hypothetical protein [Allosediminivita pacifica]|uniref:Uncharacterized protein n=1 Tax=Allosediminivita pacifica TaxID=1267769 RepID=A0A2T6ABF8_9RHOB|nr:hypothetical protein [Allosediminivita pacifica]PTX41102.1 hypothetical protein C8N44_1326 [Allosediminivita pacifica]GGB25204.1 hypothetical protein GCM10011324_38860 [Allosediminivita pacifica]